MTQKPYKKKHDTNFNNYRTPFSHAFDWDNIAFLNEDIKNRLIFEMTCIQKSKKKKD